MKTPFKTKQWIIFSSAAALAIIALNGCDSQTSTPISQQATPVEPTTPLPTSPTTEVILPTVTGPTVTATSRPVPSATPGTPTPSSTSPTPSAGPDDVPMAEIPAGEFIMGLTLEQATSLRERWQTDYGQPGASITFDNASPQLTIDLPSFKIDKVEVTKARYAPCVSAGVCQDIGPVPPEEADKPVIVPAKWAQTYCQWVGKRLPTEAEWEKAARGSDGRIFPWGDAWEAGRVGTKISAVGSHPQDSSPYGVLDMAGNASEWTLSPYEAYPGHPLPALFAPEEQTVRGTLLSEPLWAGAVTANRARGLTSGFRCLAGSEPVSVAEAVIAYEPIPPLALPTATTVELSEMVEIPAGSFLRGVDEQSLTTDEDRRIYHDAIPQQSVYLDRYYIDRFPVTTIQYIAFLNVLGQHRWACGGWHCANVYEGGYDPSRLGYIKYENKQYSLDDEDLADFPVIVTWYGAQAYCTWQGKRLPTEAEWEKAARGTDGRLYPWGNELDARAQEHKNPFASTHDPIGAKPFLASPYGVQDLIGISSYGEWVADWYAEDYYARVDSTNNPQGPPEGKEKVRRGETGTIYVGIPYRAHAYAIIELAGSLSASVFRCAYDPPSEP